MSAAWLRRPWASVVVFIIIAASVAVPADQASQTLADCNECAATRQHQLADDGEELQLIQVHSSLANGKQRAAKPSLEVSHPRRLVGTSGEDSDDDIRAAFLEKILHYGIRSKSATASSLVFGFNGKYCERRFGGLLNYHARDGDHGPEITNTATAVFIVLVGVYQLAAWEIDSAFIRLLSAFVVVNGWSSAVRHFADIPFCAVLDGTTMVVGASLGCCLLADLGTQRMKDKLGIGVLRVIVWAVLPFLLIISFFRNAGAFAPHTASSAFRYLFALPLVAVTIVIVGSLWLNWVTWTTIDADTLEVLKWQLKVGIPMCLLGAACLGVSELFCDETPVAQYFPGHALWHLFFPFGVNALLLYICVLYADTKHLQMRFRQGAPGCKAKWYRIAPSFTTRQAIAVKKSFEDQ